MKLCSIIDDESHSEELETSTRRFLATARVEWAPGVSKTYDKEAGWTKQHESEHRHLYRKVDNLMYKIIQMEVRLGIDECDRWQPGDEKYQKVLEYKNTRRFQKALDRLQKLVVQRLFELQKLNIAGTGEYLPASSLHAG